MTNLSEAYSDDEPEYTTDMIKEKNPDYNPTLEIISNEEWYDKTKKGVEEMINNEIVEWDSIN